MNVACKYILYYIKNITPIYIRNDIGVDLVSNFPYLFN